MRRKLIQHGLSSLTVSLPVKWVNSKGLKKGMEVEVAESMGKLVISSEKNHVKKRFDLDVSGSLGMIRRMVGATFKSGYDEVNIAFNSYEELKALQELVREQFTGFEIVSQEKDKVRIRNISGNSFIEFDSVLRRLFLVVKQMAQELTEAVAANDLEWVRRISLLKGESDKCSDYCRRALNMGFQPEGLKPCPLYTLIEQLEKAADRYSELCIYIYSAKLKTSPSANACLEELSIFLHNFYTLFFKFSIGKMEDFLKSKISLQKRIDGIALTCQKKELKSIILCERITNLLFDMNGPLMAAHL